MKNIINKIKKNVNFDKYSRSEGYIGSFNKCIPYKLGLPETSVRHFLNFFSASMFHGYYISSLYTLGKRELIIARENIKENIFFRNALLQKDLIFFHDDEISDNLREKYTGDNMKLNLCKMGKLSDLSQDDIAMLALAGYCPGFYGYLFFYFERHQLVVYPNDDIGFGVINIGDDKEYNYFGVEFLLNAARINGFVSNVNYVKYP